jgi:hypothetical protein
MNLLNPLAIVATREQLPAVVPIDDLVARFKAARSGETGGVRQRVASQIECGRLLELMQQQIKATVGAGYWTAWVQLNCDVTLRQVQRYVKRWREFCKINQRVGSDATSMSLLARRDLLRLDQDK